MRPNTLTDFRRLGAAKLRRGGRSAEAAKQLHDERHKRHKRYEKKSILSVATWQRNMVSEPPKHIRLIPLGGHNIRKTGYHRAKNWVGYSPCFTTHAQRKDNGRYSSRSIWTHYTYIQKVESWGAVANGTLFARIQDDDGRRTVILRPWRGWHWAIDANGICLRSGKRDYHPSAVDLLRGLKTREFAALARENHKLRSDFFAAIRHNKRLIAQAEREGAQVCIRDALVAGNCFAGITNWCHNHKLDPTSHIKPTRLLSLANGNAEQIAIVVGVAMKRHRAEMRQGFCVLAEHRKE